jgi:hypothetical protein
MRMRFIIPGLLLAILPLLAGCRTAQLKPADESAIAAGRMSLVLFRATVSDPKDPKRILPMRGFRARLARMDRPERVRVFASDYNDMNTGPRVLAPTTSSAAEGWRCLALEPGTYFLELDYGQNQHLDYCEKVDHCRISGNGGSVGLLTFGRHGQIFSNQFRLLPAYRIEVPSNAPVVYAGRFHLEQHLEKNSGFSPFKRVRLGPDMILDESAAAERIALERFPSLGENAVASNLATSLDDQRSLWEHVDTMAHGVEGIRGAQFTTGDVAPHAAEIFGGPVVWLAAFMNYYPPGPSCCSDDDEEETTLSEDVTKLALVLAAAPFAAAADKVAGDAIRKKWMPNEKELKKQFEEFHLEERLAGALTDRLEKRQADQAQAKVDSRLQIQPTRVCLREVERGRFALEVAVRFRLVRSDNQRLIWEQTLVNSEGLVAQSCDYGFLPFPYEALIPGSTAARPLSAYEPPDGRIFLEQDLAEAVTALCDGFLRLARPEPREITASP